MNYASQLIERVRILMAKLLYVVYAMMVFPANVLVVDFLTAGRGSSLRVL